jgi:hypothetical protein
VSVGGPIIEAVEPATTPIASVDQPVVELAGAVAPTVEPSAEPVALIVEAIAAVIQPIAEPVEEIVGPAVDRTELAVEVAGSTGSLPTSVVAPIVGILLPGAPSLVSTKSAIESVAELGVAPSRPVTDVVEPVSGAFPGNLPAWLDVSITLIFAIDLEPSGHTVGPLFVPVGEQGEGPDARMAEAVVVETAGDRLPVSSSTDPLGGSSSPDVASPFTQPGDVEEGAPNPQPAPLLAHAFPFDLGSLGRSIQQLLGWLKDFSQRAVGWTTGKELLAWLLAMVLTTAAYEIVRRESRRSQLDGTGLDDGSMWPDSL